MVSSEVQRTLVKSPPELWAELSDPAALARHLGELGEIHITRVEPEQKVEWEAHETSGTVLIDPSGWGTRVTLTATREISEPESPRASDAPTEPDVTAPSQPGPAPSQPDAAAPSQPGPAPSQPDAAAPSQPESPAPSQPDAPAPSQPAFDTGAEPAPMESEPQPQPEPEPALEDRFTPALERRRSFFARLFRRHTAIAPPSFEPRGAGFAQPPEPPDAFAAVTRALAPETFAAAHPFATAHLATPTPPQTQAQQADEAPQANDASAEIRTTEDAATEGAAVEDVAEEKVTAVLTSVLDRLGAAHHRPFSRA